MGIASGYKMLPTEADMASAGKIDPARAIENVRAPIGKYLVRPWSEEVMKRLAFRTSLIIPDKAKPGNTEGWIGVVVDVGEEKVGKDGKKIPMQLQLHDTVVYRKWGGAYVEIGRRQIRVLSNDPVDNEILGTFERPNGKMIQEEEIR